MLCRELPLAWLQKQNGDGYSKAVDMFSIGAITVMLLKGELPSVTFETSKDDLGPGGDSIQTALPGFTSSSQWSMIGKRARRFIQQLLVKDEHQRMTVEQALKHRWFTNRHHVAEFEALYA